MPPLVNLQLESFPDKTHTVYDCMSCSHPVHILAMITAVEKSQQVIFLPKILNKSCVGLQRDLQMNMNKGLHIVFADCSQGWLV